MKPELFTDVCPPAQGMIAALAHSATAARYEIPAAWKESMVTFVTSGSDLYVAFGDGGVKVGTAKFSQVSGQVVSPHWGSAILVPAGSAISVPVGGDITHYSVVSSGTSGSWCAWRSSGYPAFGDVFPITLPAPALWLDFGVFSSVTTSSGITQVVGRSANQAVFAEATNKAAYNDAITVGSGLMRPAAGFTAGSSHKLVCSAAAIAALFDGDDPFTLLLPVRRGATGALHTLISVATDGSANGHWDLTLNASDDVVYTRVDSAGSSTASTYATTMSAAMALLTLVYDGAAPALYVNRAAVSLSGTATGNLGTASKVALGARLVNTSTYDQFATAEIPEVMAFNSALGTADLIKLHAWAQRRYGV